jgi:hypothetical protein
MLPQYSPWISFVASKNGADHTPIPPVLDIVKQLSNGPPPTVRDPNPHGRNGPISRHFCNTSPASLANFRLDNRFDRSAYTLGGIPGLKIGALEEENLAPLSAPRQDQSNSDLAGSVGSCG